VNLLLLAVAVVGAIPYALLLGDSSPIWRTRQEASPTSPDGVQRLGGFDAKGVLGLSLPATSRGEHPQACTSDHYKEPFGSGPFGAEYLWW